MKSYIKIVKAMFSGNKRVLAEAFSVMVILLALEMTIPVCVNKMINGLAVENGIVTFLGGIILFACAYGSVCFLSALNTKLYIRIGNQLLWNMREQIYKVLWYSGYMENVQKKKDKFKFVLSNQAYAAFAIAVIYSIGGFTNLLSMIAFLVIVFLYSVPVGMTLIICIFVTLVVSFFTGKKILEGYETCNVMQEKDTSQIYETVDMVAFGLVPASREVAQVVGVVNVIFHPAVGFEREQPGVHVANHLAPLVRKPDDAQPLSVRMGIFAQEGEDRAEVALADGLHVTDALAAVDLEADHQEAVDHGPGTVVHRLPAVHVGEGEVAVADARGHGIALDGLFILEAHGFEFNHGRCNSFFLRGNSIAGQGRGSPAGGSPRPPPPVSPARRRTGSCRRSSRPGTPRPSSPTIAVAAVRSARRARMRNKAPGCP